MSGYIPAVDRHQTVLLPDALDDFVGAENPVRVINAFVDGLALADFGFTRSTPAETGRPGYDPRALLKLYLYGYLHRVRSSRRLERETQCNVEVMWLVRRLTPDYKTISDFRTAHAAALPNVFRAFTVVCRQLELFGAELVGIDGTKLRAVNAKARSHTPPEVRRHLRASTLGSKRTWPSWTPATGRRARQPGRARRPSPCGRSWRGSRSGRPSIGRCWPRWRRPAPRR